ncbi:hypothetical protein, conserved [Plasmodium gonderi]|uniref:Uncharacterized protein n=1 Tax=Plasmodium gonderi TaxID=77519 RepID=A0A1Y1JPW9_PLAGO|nr:hypothetical protein, conserved [Plasmodium gonderi]GAW83267.1 hypothetical protein, conserved [Plasmodium gonderi]
MKHSDKDAHQSRPYYDDRDYDSVRKEYRSSYKRVLWPLNVGIHDIDDKNLKRELCLIVTNIPVDWTKFDITWFFREYFYKLAINKNIQFPLIEHVYLIKNEPSAILACHDGVSREIIQNLSNCVLRNVKDKKKIILTIQPYYKKDEAREKEKRKEKSKEKNKEKNKEEENELENEDKKEKQDQKEQGKKNADEHIQEKKEGNEKRKHEGENGIDVEKEKEFLSEDEVKAISRLRKRSLTPPRKHGMEWPSNLDLRNCSDMELRRKLCVFGRYKPLHWGVKELAAFLKHYFDTLKKDHANFEIPEISDMWADKGTHLVTFACKNEKSRFNMLLIRACYLNDDDAKNNIKNSLRVWLQFEKWTPYKSSINFKYKNYIMPRGDFNKYSYIHEHTIDKGNYKRTFRKPPYDDYARNRTNSYRSSVNVHSKMNPPENYYYHNKDDRSRRNYDNVKDSHAYRSPSPHYSKYKKKYSRSPTPKNYHKKKFRRSRSHDSRKDEMSSHWRKNNKSHH